MGTVCLGFSICEMKKMTVPLGGAGPGGGLACEPCRGWMGTCRDHFPQNLDGQGDVQLGSWGLSVPCCGHWTFLGWLGVGVRYQELPSPQVSRVRMRQQQADRVVGTGPESIPPTGSCLSCLVGACHALSLPVVHRVSSCSDRGQC